MTDFYSVLQRAVSSLPDGSGPNRRAVYDKARKALLKQLQSFDPPLPSADVTAQRLALEDAIRKIENEIARQIRTQRALQSAMPAKGAVRRPAGDGVSDAAASAIAAKAAEAERAAQRKAEAERARRQHAAMLENAVSEATIESPAEDETLRSTAPVPVTAQPVHGYDPEPHDDGTMFEEEAHYEDEAHSLADQRQHDDIVDGEYDEVDEAEEPAYGTAPPAVDPRPSAPPRRSRKDEKRARKEEERRLKAERQAARKKPSRKAAKRAAAPGERRKRGGGLGRAVLPLILLALLVGAAYAAYTQREALLAVLDELQEDPAQRPPITVTSNSDGASKNSDRLPSTLDGEDTRTVTTTTWPPREQGDAEATPDAQTDAGTAAPLPSADRSVGTEISPFAPDVPPTPAEEQASDGAGSDESAAADTAETEVAAATPPAETASEATQSDGTPDTPISEFTPSGTQQAVLYEEAAVAGEKGTAVAGGVEWAMVRESIGGGSPEPIVRATAEIPERNMTATVTVRENLDGALPASHLIEIAFDLPDGFEGGGVKNVPGMIMKQNEDARGEALRGRGGTGLLGPLLDRVIGERDGQGEQPASPARAGLDRHPDPLRERPSRHPDPAQGHRRLPVRQRCHPGVEPRLAAGVRTAPVGRQPDMPVRPAGPLRLLRPA